VNGGPVTLRGYGFTPGLAVSIGTTSLKPLRTGGGEMILALPARSDGAQTITISDPATGGSSVMTSAITYGAAATDLLVLLSGANPLTAVGTQAVNPVSALVLASDNKTPVAGATIVWNTMNGATLSACGGAATCSVASDESGMVSTWVTLTASGTSTVTASLAPASYSAPKLVTATLFSKAPGLDIGLVTPFLFVSRGVTVTVPLSARVVSSGVPQAGSIVNFQVMQGSGSVAPASASADANGYASTSLSLPNLSGTVVVSACVAPANVSCQNFTVTAVPTDQQHLQCVSGAGQIVATGHAFQPLTLRVIDAANPPHPVMTATVGFQTTLLRPVADGGASGSGETNTGQPATPVVLSQSQTSIVTDGNGLATLVPSAGGFTGRLEVDVIASAASGDSRTYALQSIPGLFGSVGAPPSSPAIREPFSERAVGMERMQVSKRER